MKGMALTKAAGQSLKGITEMSAIEIDPETCNGIGKVREVEQSLIPDKESFEEGETNASDGDTTVSLLTSPVEFIKYNDESNFTLERRLKAEIVAER